MKKFKYIYGPVQSWRMGKSLGIDPLSDIAKICNLNCVYCQLGKTYVLTNKRQTFIPTTAVVNEIKDFYNYAETEHPELTDNIDYITFSGRGEPTLAANLGEMIKGIRQFRSEEIAVITNSTLLYLPDVQRDVGLSDLVIAKLDACNEQSFHDVDHGIDGVSFEKVIDGLRSFRKYYRGRLAIQVMFVEKNRKYARQIAALVRGLEPDEIQINTPLRPSAAKPLSKEGIEEIKVHFAGMPASTLYDCERKESCPYNQHDTIKRHGNYKIAHI